MKILLPIIIICAIFLVVMPVMAGIDCRDGEGIVCIPNPLKYEKFEDILKAITTLLRTIAILLGTIMIIWGGIQIMTGMATGEKEKKVMAGKKTITWAIIGVAIVIAVDFIVGIVKEIIGRVE